MVTGTTTDELQQRALQLRNEVEQLDREIGAATLDGRSPASARKRLIEAVRKLKATQAALAELERRQDAEEEEAQRAAASAAREQTYRWIADYMTRIEKVLEARKRLREAEEALLAHGNNTKLSNAKRGLRGDFEETDLDPDLAHAVPAFPSHPGTPLPVGAISLNETDLTADRVCALRELAEQRADEEARGEGQDFTGVPIARIRARRERRTRGATPS